MGVVCNILLLVILLAGCSSPQLTPGTNLSPNQGNYDNGFDNPFLKALSPNWKGPKYWWLTSVKKDNFKTVFSNATSNLEFITRHLNLTERTGTEDQANDPSSEFTLNNEQILIAFGNRTSSSFAEPSRLDNLPGPNVGLVEDQIKTSTPYPEPSRLDNFPIPNVGFVEIKTSTPFPEPSRLDNLPGPNVGLVRVQIPPVIKPPPQCECLKHYQCFDNGTIKTLGDGLLDNRQLFPKSDTDCAPDEVFCCLPGTPLTQIGCGKQPPNLYPGLFADRILPHNDNEDTYPGEFPWMVTLLVNKDVEGPGNLHLPNYYKCGGAIIDRFIVITAAHCLYNTAKEMNYPPEALKIRAGLWNLLDDQHEEEFFQDRLVREIIVHPLYKRPTLIYDYALLVLSEALDFSNGRIGKICLPNAEEDLSQSLECIVTGWGKNKLGKDGEIRPILKKLNMPLLDHKECQSRLRTTRLSVYFELHESFICGRGIVGLDTCKGDGGSPLVCKPPGSSEFHLTGLVSWGIDCGTDIPGVYANVGNSVQWISDIRKEILNRLKL